MEDLDRLSALRSELVNRIGRQRYDFLTGQTTLEFSDNTLLVGCPSPFELQFVRRRLHCHLLAGSSQLGGKEISIEYFIRPEAEAATKDVQSLSTQKDLFDDGNKTSASHKEKTSISEPGLSQLTQPESSVGELPKTRNRNNRSLANSSKSTFAGFVSGPCNELALRTSKTIASRLGHYGPLLLYGPPGVGKTHLLHAILHEIRGSNSGIRCVRLTAEQFTSEFLAALNSRTSPGFRHKYRSVDVLVIDDIQFLVGKRATLEELLITIDSLTERGKQVVLASVSAPLELQKSCPELLAKVSGGLTIPMELPDYATRLALVRRFLAQMHPVIGMAIDGQIASLVANQIAGSARQLRGAINRLIVTSEALRKPLTLDLARSILAEYVQQITPAVRLVDIQRAVCEVFQVEASSLKSRSKTRSLAEPRMVAMWLSCNLTRSALGEISEFFGRRSHSTVISAQRRIDRMVNQGAQISVADRTCNVEEAIRKVRAALRTA